VLGKIAMYENSANGQPADIQLFRKTMDELLALVGIMEVRFRDIFPITADQHRRFVEAMTSQTLPPYIQKWNEIAPEVLKYRTPLREQYRDK
jgi:hypothetical protein